MSFQYPVAEDQLYVFFILIGSVGHLGHFILMAMEEMQEKQVETYILLPPLVENQHNVTSVHILLVKSSHMTKSNITAAKSLKCLDAGNSETLGMTIQPFTVCFLDAIYLYLSYLTALSRKILKMLNCNTVVRSCFLTEDFKGTRFSTSVAEAMLYIHQNIPLFFFAIYTENYIPKPLLQLS